MLLPVNSDSRIAVVSKATRKNRRGLLALRLQSSTFAFLLICTRDAEVSTIHSLRFMANALQSPIIDLEALRVSYDTRRLLAERFATRLSEQITELLNKEGISLALPIENRVKSWESISDKIDRNKLNLSDVATLNDFVGLRLILLFRRDVGRVRELLSSELHVLSSEDTLERLGAEQFGYQSIHLQLKLPDGWYSGPRSLVFAT